LKGLKTGLQGYLEKKPGENYLCQKGTKQNTGSNVKYLELEELANAGQAFLELYGMDRLDIVTERGVFSFNLEEGKVIEKMKLDEGLFREGGIRICSDWPEGSLDVYALVDREKVVFIQPSQRRVKTVPIPEGRPNCCWFQHKGLLHIGYNGYMLEQSSGDRFKRTDLKFSLEDGIERRIDCRAVAFDWYHTYIADSHVLAKVDSLNNIEPVVLNDDFNSLVSSDNPSCIALDNLRQARSIWIGRRGGGLVLVKDGDVRFFGGSDARGGVENLEVVKSIEKDGEVYWAATPNSLFRIEEAEGVTFEEFGLRGLVKGFVRAFKVKNGNFTVLSSIAEEEGGIRFFLTIFNEEELVDFNRRRIPETRGEAGYPAVRVSYTEYESPGEVRFDFWSLKEHKLMAEAKVEDFQGFQRGHVEEIKSLARELGEDLNPIIDTVLGKHRVLVPCYAEKIRYKGRDSWVVVANWEMEEEMPLSHIAILVIDEETKEVVVYEQCE
jgi:hypothetical protein